MFRLIGFLILIADIWAILKIAQSPAKNVEKALWILIILVLPFVGLVAWYFLGPGQK